MVIRQILPRVDNSMHVSLHQFCNYVNVLKTRPRRRFRHVQNLNDVLMVKEFQQFNLSDDALSVDEIFESLWHFFDGDFDLSLVVISAADDAVCAMPDLFYVFKFVLDDECCSYKSISKNGGSYLHI